jgi:hypothetical protein
VNGSQLPERPQSNNCGHPEYDPQHPVAADQEQQRYEHQHAGDQARTPQQALARLPSAPDAQRVAPAFDLTEPSQHAHVTVSSSIRLDDRWARLSRLGGP